MIPRDASSAEGEKVDDFFRPSPFLPMVTRLRSLAPLSLATTLALSNCEDNRAARAPAAVPWGSRQRRKEMIGRAAIEDAGGKRVIINRSIGLR
jgi:hypothetical protein